MKESSTYQAILQEGRQEGRQEEARKAIRLLGDDAFGPPDAATAALLDKLDDLSQLEELLKRVPTAASWQDLLGARRARSQTGRRRSTK